MRLLWAHHEPPPPALRPVPSPLTGQPLATDEAVMWGPRAAWEALAAAAPGARVLSTDPVAVARARGQGLVGVLVPDRAADTLELATRPQVWCVPRGTLWPDEGVLWVEGGVEPLSPGMRRLALQLTRGSVASDPGLRVAVSRLRKKLGGGIVTERGAGWRLVTVGPEPATRAPEPVWRGLATGRYAPELHVAEVHGARLALSAAETAALERLWQAEGQPVATDTLDRRVGGSVAVVIHRLRRKLGRDAIATVRGVGYRLALPEAGDLPPLLVRIDQASAEHPAVFVTGAVGSGKTRCLRRVAARRGQRVVDLHGMPVASQARRLAVIGDQPPRALLVDGLRDGDALHGTFDRLVDAGFRLVVGSRVAPRGAPEVPLPAADPTHLEAESIPRRLARLAEVPDVDRAAAFPHGILPGEVPRALLRTWQRQGILVGPGLPHLPGPLREAVWSTWDEEQRLAWAAASIRRYLVIESQPLHHQGALEAAAQDALMAVPILHAADRSAASFLASVGALSAQAIDPSWIDTELARTDLPGNDRALLLQVRFRARPETDLGLLREAIEVASGETRADLQVQLAYYLPVGDEHNTLLDAAEAWLETRPAHEAVWVRSEALLVGSHRLDDPIGALMEQALRLERARLEATGGDLRTESMRRRTLHHLGQLLLFADRPAEAISALETAARMRRSSLAWGSVELVAAWGRLERWKDARAEIDRTLRELERVPSWAALLLTVRGINALLQGDRTTARALWTASAHADRTVAGTRATLGLLLDIAEGRTEISELPLDGSLGKWISTGQLSQFAYDVRSGVWADGWADDPLARPG